jgi:hypothetical protein
MKYGLQKKTQLVLQQFKLLRLAGVTALLAPIVATAANVVLVPSPFQRPCCTWLERESVLPAIDRSIAVEGARVGEVRAAITGDSLLALSYRAKESSPSVAITSDISFTTGDATLNLKAGDMVVPRGRLLDPSGRIYYLLLTDPKTSSFLSKYRYFAVAETGETLDRAFSELNDTYSQREKVKISGGSLNVSFSEKLGKPQCSLATVFLGNTEGTLKFKLVRAGADGVVNAEKLLSFAAGTKVVTLPGAVLTIKKADAKAINARVDKLEPVTCTADM